MTRSLTEIIRQKTTDITLYAVLRMVCRLNLSQTVPSEHQGSDYGGWNVVPTPITPQSTVYSFGIGEDISFDLSLIHKYGCTVFAFDPTPRSIAWLQTQKLPDQFRYFEYGVADFDGRAAFYAPENPEYVSHTLLRNVYRSGMINVEVCKLKTIMRRLGHTQIDVLKMDIEGAEYSVIRDIIASGIKPGQILVEFHHGFRGISGAFQTARAIISLSRSGYTLFHVSDSYREYSFISTSLLA